MTTAVQARTPRLAEQRLPNGRWFIRCAGPGLVASPPPHGSPRHEHGALCISYPGHWGRHHARVAVLRDGWSDGRWTWLRWPQAARDDGPGCPGTVSPR